MAVLRDGKPSGDWIDGQIVAKEEGEGTKGYLLFFK